MAEQVFLECEEAFREMVFANMYLKERTRNVYVPDDALLALYGNFDRMRKAGTVDMEIANTIFALHELLLKASDPVNIEKIDLQNRALSLKESNAKWKGLSKQNLQHRHMTQSDEGWSGDFEGGRLLRGTSRPSDWSDKY